MTFRTINRRGYHNLFKIGYTYDEFIEKVITPVFWHRMQNITGVISTNAMYTGGIGNDVVVNGSFTSGITGWSQSGTGWTGTANVAQFVEAAGAADLYQGVVIQGSSYRVTFDILNYVSGTNPQLFLGVQNKGTFNSNGAKTIDAVNNGTTNNLQFRGNTGGNFQMDNVTCKKIGEIDAHLDNVTLSQTGLFGANEAFSFNGTTSIATIKNVAGIQGLTEFSIWLLINPTNAGEGNNGVLISKSGEFELRFNSASRDLIATVNYSGTNATSTTTTTLSVSTWHDVFLTINNTDKTAKIFIDGVEATYSGTPTAGIGTRVSNTNNLIIGNNVGTTGTFNGLIDEVFLVNRQLQVSEVNKINSFLP